MEANLVVNPTGDCLRRAIFRPSFISGWGGNRSSPLIQTIILSAAGQTQFRQESPPARGVETPAGSDRHRHPHEGCGDERAAVRALVLSVGQFDQLALEFLDFAILLRRLVSVHRGAVKPAH